MNWKCTDCNWTGTNDELRLKTYPNGGDDTICPKCGGRVEEMEEEPDPRDNPLTDDDDWIHDVDMGAR